MFDRTVYKVKMLKRLEKAYDLISKIESGVFVSEIFQEIKNWLYDDIKSLNYKIGKLSLEENKEECLGGEQK